MKTNRHTLQNIIPVLTAGAVLFLASCSSTSTPQPTPEKEKVEISTSRKYKEGVPGGTIIETYKFTATITRIDPQSRSVALLAPDGTYDTFKAEPASATFDRLVEGQQVIASVARELLIFLGKEGPPATEGPTAAVALAAKEGTSDVFITKWLQRDAVVTGIDRNQRLVTLTFSDGTNKTFSARKDVDMRRIKNGDDVVILTGSAATLTPVE